LQAWAVLYAGFVCQALAAGWSVCSYLPALSRPRITQHYTFLYVLQVGEADDGAGGKIFINKYEAQIAETEDEAAYQTSMTAPKIPVVINEAKRNMYGSPRGYKVQLNRPMVNLEPEGYNRSKALGERCWQQLQQIQQL
jgi:hypothetical protein